MLDATGVAAGPHGLVQAVKGPNGPAVSCLTNPCGTVTGITMPALILAGRYDLICPKEFSEEIQRLIPGSRVQVFGGSSHSFRADEPDTLNAAIRDFVTG